MNRPSFLEGVLVALGASLCATWLHAALGALVGPSAAMRLVIAGVGLGYVLYLLGRSSERVGRFTTLLAWTLVAGAAWGLGLPPGPYLLVHLGLVWAVRSLYFHAGLLAALADLGLQVLGLAAALWALLHTGSLLLGVWCFFLAQALYVAIRPRWPHRGSPPEQEGDEDAFRHAQGVADAALKRLASLR